MGSSQSQQAYGQAVGTTPTNGIWVDTRDPSNDTDTNFPIGQFWLNKGAKRLFYLDSKSMLEGVLSVVWVVISIDTVLDTLSDDNNIVVDASGASDTPPYNIQIKGGLGITVTADPSDHSLTIDNTGNTEDFDTDAGSPPVSGATVVFTNTTILATGSLTNALQSNATASDTIAYQTQYAGATAGSSAASKWGVAQFDDNQFSVTDGFVQLQGGTTAPLLSLTPDDHTAPGTTPVLPTAAGTITLEGGALFNTGTSAFAIRSNSLAANKIDLQLQRAGGNAATSTANNFGVAQFDTNSFGVTSGFVTLKNGGTTGAITTMTGNTGGALTPTSGNMNTLGTGSITIAGSGSTLTTQLTGLTQYNLLVGQGSATIGLIAPSATVGIPVVSAGAAAYPVYGTATVPGGGTGNTTFTAYSVICAGTTATGAFQNVSGVGTSGQALTSNGAGLLPTWQNTTDTSSIHQITLDAATSPITPSANNVTFTGGQVATGVVGTNVIRTRGNTSSSCTIEIQRSTVAAAQDLTLNGVCHFNSTQFSVSSQGFVSFTGSTTSFPWTDEGAPFTAAVNNGYFITASLTATMPASPSQGDVIKFSVDVAAVLTIQANTGQVIRLGNVVSATAGTAVSTLRGDSIELVYRLSGSTWMAISSTGMWGLT